MVLAVSAVVFTVVFFFCHNAAFLKCQLSALSGGLYPLQAFCTVCYSLSSEFCTVFLRFTVAVTVTVTVTKTRNSKTYRQMVT